MDLTKPLPRLLRLLAAFCAALLAVAFLFSLSLAGGSVFAFLRYAAVFLFCLLPGLLLAELFWPDQNPADRPAAALLLSAALLFFSYLTFGRITPLATVLPVIPLGLWQLLRLWKRRRSIRAALCQFHPTYVHLLLLLALCGGVFVYLFSGIFTFARASAAGNMTYHQDMMWSVGNAAAVQLGSPLPDIRTAGSLLRYHYLADALPGFIAMFSGVLPYEAVCFYNYPLLLFFLVLCLYTAARRYGACPSASAILPFAVRFLNGWQSGATLNLLRNMNGVATATALSAALLTLIFPLLEKGARLTAGQWVVCCCGLVVLLMSKNLYGILLCCALAATVLFGLLFQKRLYRNALVLSLSGFVLFGLCWLLVYRYAINNLVFSIWQSPAALLRDLFLGLPLGALLWLAAALLALRRIAEISPARLVVNAAAAGGLVAYFIFHHYSASQEYFLLAAFLFCWFGALDLLPILASHRPLLAGASLLGVLCLACTALTLMPVGRSGVQVALRCLDLRPEYPYTVETVTKGDEEAALWLREQMDPEEVFAVNRNAKDPTVGEGTWHYYTAVSGRQCYVESWRYSMDYGADYTRLRYQLEQVSDRIFAQTQAQDAFALARAEGIRFLLVSRPLKPEGFVGAQPVFENDAVLIYEVPAA